uniref:Protein phosphatase 1 regulatory subunit 7 n=1 Tax=Chromera velia CCMP2878 TaxID=1169474 RepID=A0A0G4I1N7_9ALVE|eukprot:Cvel_1680.t1-p1 / transcript=Cvel_1680.t1 / gene=Cvel_1680 / organism=Chromera_velia_CCMP2878 / gene_product=Protein phosphatase 1 regulatory subunit 7, putative / transcript_product=Protein phosphatase 1 regulatory subunit 7, putative / location=Cvel_scaffold60:91687-97475(+) / protein_length=493 / sequence_SO=supercontig / SO=protein_coding / is_pseudo=false
MQTEHEAQPNVLSSQQPSGQTEETSTDGKIQDTTQGGGAIGQKSPDADEDRDQEMGLADSAEEQTEEAVTYLRIGSDHKTDPAEEELTIQTGRIRVIENLDACTRLKKLCLIANHVHEITGLDTLVELEHLELYQNYVQRIQNIGHLVKLKVLDLSFNEIRKIEGLETLTELERLFLSANKIRKIENLEGQKKLQMLELGNNRIRQVENLDHMTSLRELWLGKNKIETMKVPRLPKLETISVQSNRLTEWDGSIFDVSEEGCLESLFLSHNQLGDIPEGMVDTQKLRGLTTLDLAGNVLTRLGEITKVESLEELWMNDNQISTAGGLEGLEKFQKMKTIYLERNPMQRNLGPAYRTLIRDKLPKIEQIDAVSLTTTFLIRESDPVELVRGAAKQKQPQQPQQTEEGAQASAPTPVPKMPSKPEEMEETRGGVEPSAGQSPFADLAGVLGRAGAGGGSPISPALLEQLRGQQTAGGRPLMGKVGKQVKSIMKKR